VIRIDGFDEQLFGGGAAADVTSLGTGRRATVGWQAIGAGKDDREVALAVDSSQARSRMTVGNCAHGTGAVVQQSIGKRMNC